MKSCVVGTHLKYMACNLKTTNLLDCALIGVCEIIGTNMVDTTFEKGLYAVCQQKRPRSASVFLQSEGRLLSLVHPTVSDDSVSGQYRSCSD